MSLTSAQNGGGVHNDAVPSNIETGTPHDKPGLCANKTLVVIFGAICVAVALAVAVGVGVGVTQRKTTEAPKLTTSVAAVEAAIKLPYTKSDFTAEKQDSFRKAMAKAAVTSVGDVKIKSITEVPSRRSSSDSSWIDRRAGGGFIRVDFSVALASADAATEILSAMSSDNINKALVREGLPEGVIVSKPQIKFLDSQSEAQAASPPPQAPPSPPAPPASRRAAFVPFESCEAIAVSFGGASVAADSQLKEQLAVDEPFYDFPEDYCDTCNCSLKKPAEQEQVFKSGVVMTTMSPTAPQTDAAQASTAKSSAAADSSAGASTAESAQDFTGTNNQVEGVDEADSIKNDGEYLYMLGVGGSRRVDWQQGKTLIIAKAFPADTAHVVSTTDLSIYSFTPTMLLLTDDALVVMGTSYVSNSDDSYSFSTTVTQLWDVSNRAAPELRKTVQVEGNLLSARMVERRVYVVTETYPSWIPRVGKKDAKTLRNVAPLFREIPATADMSPAVAGKAKLV